MKSLEKMDMEIEKLQQKIQEYTERLEKLRQQRKEEEYLQIEGAMREIGISLSDLRQWKENGIPSSFASPVLEEESRGDFPTQNMEGWQQ